MLKTYFYVSFTFLTLNLNGRRFGDRPVAVRVEHHGQRGRTVLAARGRADRSRNGGRAVVAVESYSRCQYGWRPRTDRVQQHRGRSGSSGGGAGLGVDVHIPAASL